jgi:hypothetical protein
MARSDFHSPQANRRGNADPDNVNDSPVRTEQDDSAKDEINSSRKRMTISRCTRNAYHARRGSGQAACRPPARKL